MDGQATMAEAWEETEDEPIRWLSPEEGRAFFDGQARRLLGISGEECLRRLDAGFDSVVCATSSAAS